MNPVIKMTDASGKLPSVPTKHRKNINSVLDVGVHISQKAAGHLGSLELTGKLPDPNTPVLMKKKTG